MPRSRNAFCLKPRGKQRPARVRTAPRRRLLLTVLLAIAGVLALGALAAFAAYSEQPTFCDTCHEMHPYYAAWKSGGHAAKATCVDCHIDAGLLAHTAHKPAELKELWDHFFAENRFPNYNVDVPNSRCVRCHPSVRTAGTTRFVHAQHESRAKCKDCHAQAGHTVTFEALAAEGVLKTVVATPSIAPTGTSPSSIAGHISVICQRCHDQAHMKCSQCHQAPHATKGECSDCHQPGTRFVFNHPDGADCAACHTPPSNHFGTGCSTCHTTSVAFASTTLNHPTVHHGYLSRPCAKCHPNGYATSYCTCHNGHPPRD